MIPNSPNNALPLSEQEKTALSKEILLDILENIFATYENATNETKEAKAGKKDKAGKKEKSCLLSFFIPKTLISQKPLFLSDFAGAHNMQILRTLEFSDKALNRNYTFKLVQVHHQHVFNLCGYHTLYNLIEVCKLIKSQDIQMSPKELFNPANFWKFRFQCAQYLDNYANYNGFNRTQYPWQEYHVKYGDLERGYVKPLTNDNGSFQSLVASDKNFKISHMTFGFQFKRLLYSAESLDKMQKDITEFVKAKDAPVHHMQMIMMGVTNHWFLFFAHRYLDHVEFWMLDSKNRDTLLWNKQEIDEFLKNENEKRQKEGRPIMNSFRLWIAHNAILDSQASVNLLVNCFLGNTTLYHFVADSETKIVAQGFLETFFDPEMDTRRATNQTREEAFLTDAEMDVREVIKMTREAFKNSKGDDRVQLVKKAEEYVLSYYTTFRTFLLGDKAAYLYPESRALLLEILDVSKLILTASTRQSRLLYAFRELLAELDLSEVKAA